MIKYLFILLFALSVCVSFAISEYTGMFLTIQPSSINRALGENTGLVNIWNESALGAYSNPALPALHKGLSYGITHEHHLKGSGDLPYDVGMMTLSGSGIGLTLPAPNYSGDTGINLSYAPMMSKADSRYGYNNFEHAQVYGISINACEFLRNRLPEKSLLRDMDIAIGLNKLYIEDHYDAILENGFYGSYNNASLHHLGFVARYGKSYDGKLDYDLVVGFSMFNFDKAKMSFIPGEPKYPIYRHNNIGAAVSASLPNEGRFTEYPLSEWIPVHNLASFRMLFSLLDELSEGKPISSYGTELGLLDILYLRVGYKNDVSGNIEGFTYGLGGRLSFRGLVTYKYNYSAMEGGDFLDWIKSSDHSISFDIREISKLLSK